MPDHAILPDSLPIHLISSQIETDWPWDLLLLADPDADMVRQYAKRSQIWVVAEHGQNIATMVLLPTRPLTLEIMNLAVSPEHQGRGLAKQLLQAAKAIAQEQGFLRLEVATGNSSLAPLALYQKAGFRLSHIEHDFFVKNYPEPIFENGIQCQNLIHLYQMIWADCQSLWLFTQVFASVDSWHWVFKPFGLGAIK